MTSDKWQKRILTVWTTAGLLLLTGSYSHACTCMAFPEDAAEAARIAYERADAVFLGDVLGPGNASDGPGNYLDVKVNVRRAWKGVTSGSSITVRTSRSSASCGFPFRKGPYLVFAYEDEEGGVFLTGLCDLNLSEKAAARHISALDKLVEAGTGAGKGNSVRDKCSKRRPSLP